MTPKPTRLPAVLTCLLAVAAALAGCTGANADATRIVIDFPDGHADVDDHVTLAAIAKAGDEPTAHVQLLAWSAATDTPVDVREFSFGHCVDAIDHVPETPGCSPGASGFWALSLNGQEVSSGMDEVLLADGDVVTWTFTPLEGNASSPSGPTLSVDPVVPTQQDMLMLTGKVDRDVRLSVTGVPATQVKAGPWMVHVPLGYGETPLVVTADDGLASAQAQVVAVRLASATFEAKFTMAVPPHAAISDLVWYDPDALASAPMYDGKDVQHPPTANVHDLMVAWSQQAGKAIDYGYFSGLGFSPDKIDGVGQPLTASAPPYWCYKLNGQSSDLGISAQPLTPGDVVTWEYAGCA